ncbi:MAG: FAD-dependent monooxygenase [Verrucomicrobiae bacterium]|nr:FAD-dependent monooxygenase [Verrucomicrobiae bacterium]
MKSSAEIAVVGAGPVGCLASIALAQKGHAVTVFEADCTKRDRFAGEWLHPSGIEILRQWGVLGLDESLPGGVSHRGFAIFPDDASEPVLLEYPGNARGMVCEHANLVETLRQKAQGTAGVEFVTGARVSSVSPGKIIYRKGGSGGLSEFTTDQIVGADGRSSVVRAGLSLSRGSRRISHMAGLLLRDIDLPFEEYGHVILGAPGPILLYRVAPDLVRASIDVPNVLTSDGSDWPALLAECYGPFIPESIRGAFLQSVKTESLAFRANGFRSRVDYGNEMMSLVGDAVGFHHPLTAMGMTLGFQDADGLARAASFTAFEKQRRSVTLVPELLAMALYQAFSGRDEGAREIRKAIYQMWRRYPNERERTMRLLSGDVTSPFRFSISFLRGIQLALTGSVDLKKYRLEWSQLGPTLGSIGQILLGLASNSSARISRSALGDLALRR